MIFFIFLNLDIKNYPNVKSGQLSGYMPGLQVWRPSMMAQIILLFEIWRYWFSRCGVFYVFFHFLKNLDVKKT